MFTKEQFKAFRQDVEQALKEVEQKHGVTITAGNISYTDINFSMKLEVKANEVNGKSFEQAEFEKYCYLFGFSPLDYGKRAVNLGQEYTLKGFLPKKRKNPVKVSIGNKDYVISEEKAKLLFKVNEEQTRENLLQGLKNL